MSRWNAEHLFVSIGMACVVAGGLLAAVTASGSTQRSAWLTAYLVLIGGVAQMGLGWGQAKLARQQPARGTIVAQLLCFNLGNAGVVLGTFLAQPLLVDAGGLALVASLILFLLGARGGTPRRVLRAAYYVLLGILIVSIPIGLTLAHLRAS